MRFRADADADFGAGGRARLRAVEECLLDANAQRSVLQRFDERGLAEIPEEQVHLEAAQLAAVFGDFGEEVGLALAKRVTPLETGCSEQARTIGHRTAGVGVELADRRVGPFTRVRARRQRRDCGERNDDHESRRPIHRCLQIERRQRYHAVPVRRIEATRKRRCGGARITSR